MKGMTKTIVFVCGVCGAGKTSVGRQLAEDFHAMPFLDADDYHSPASLEKLRRSVPLTDDDRGPWLERVADAAEAAAASTTTTTTTTQGGNAVVVVVACSALKSAYRVALRRRAAGCDVDFCLLDPPEGALRARLEARGAPGAHALPDAAAALQLLPSQLAELERGGWSVVLEGEAALAPAREQARELARRLRERWGSWAGSYRG